MSYEYETDLQVPRKIYAGLAAVRDHLAEKGLAKNQTNSHQGFKFRGIDDLYGVLQKALAKFVKVGKGMTYRKENTRG